ncbi:MAG: NAD-dependent epimerase/dehydratase family protein [Synergistaceae bacterium]
MGILITGGGGFTGSKLAEYYRRKDEKVIIFDVAFSDELLRSASDKIVPVKGDVSNWHEIFNVINDYNIKTIFHLAAILTVPSEANPWRSIDVNALGTYHVLEAARILQVNRVLYTSSIGAYGVTRDTVVTNQTVQRPTSIYGVSKVFGELLGLYYHRKYGIDFRGVRFPSLLGPGVKTPGVGQYNPLVIEAAIKGEPFEIWAPEDTVIPMMYIKDAVRCLVMLDEAPADSINTRIYNVGQITPPPTAAELVAVVKQFYPGASIAFKPDPDVMEILKTIPRVITSDEAEAEWGWNIAYSIEDTVRDFIDEFGKLPRA